MSRAGETASMTERRVLLRLYVAGRLPNSQRAMANLSAFCQRHLPERHHIEVVDVLASPDRALKDRILLTPTLVIVEPPPVRTLVGDLSATAALEQALAGEIDRGEAGAGHRPSR